MSIYIHIRIGDVLWGYHGISGYLFCISCHIIFYVCIYRYILCIYIYNGRLFFLAFFCFWFLVFCFWFLFFGFWFLRFLVSGLYLLVYNSHIYIDRCIYWDIVGFPEPYKMRKLRFWHRDVTVNLSVCPTPTWVNLPGESRFILMFACLLRGSWEQHADKYRLWCRGSKISPATDSLDWSKQSGT